MNDSILVREAHARDHAFIVFAQAQMAKETENLKLDHHTVELGVGAVLLDPAKGKYFVAEDRASGDAVACLLTIPEWSDWRNGTVLWIHSLYVIPPKRKSGVFKQMYEYLSTMIKADPALRGIRLYVDRRNQAAQNVYEKLGMTKEHYEMFEWMKP